MESEHNLPKPKKIRITSEKAFKLVGCVYYGDPFHSSEEWSIENEIGVLWNRFFRLCQTYGHFIQEEAVNDRAYEVHIQPEDYHETGKFFVYVGIEVKKLEKMPIEMFCKLLPSTKYAVFTFKGEDMFKGCEYIWNYWLPNSEYDEAYPYMVQAYDKNKFRGMDNPQSEVDFYVPVNLKKPE
ncbi:MAG: GyrI-like domain-containing protein [Methanobacterium sp.]|jgi:AraC family transcriptional regulator|nr:GyrI-like domain-containing protein [Methanobacterium sp.]